MKKRFIISLLCALFFLSLRAQVDFEKDSKIFAGKDYYSGVAIGITDVNNDFLDDIIHMDDGRITYIMLQDENGSFEYREFAGTVGGSSQWSMCVADLDNDGIAEVITGSAYDGVRIIRSDRTFENFNVELMTEESFLSQNMNVVDINNDGWLDIFVCDDNDANKIYMNKGDGTFEPNHNLIDFSTTPPSDMSGNYGSIWTDFDLDGDLDLYIAKCRQGVNNPNDGRRINNLYVNTDTGFVDMAREYNLDIRDQSWSANFLDIENDLDWDVVVTNHYAPTRLMINDGQLNFSDSGAMRGIDVDEFPIQGLTADFDNNGYIDIFVTGTEHFLYFNDGTGNFIKADDPFDANQMESAALGDLNNDGFIDIYGGYANLFTNPSNTPDAIFMNRGNDNNWVRIKLKGHQNNYNGIGARVVLYSSMGPQMRQIHSGESYGINNSSTLHFGLSQDDRVDSVIVYWPDGQIQKVFDLPVNTNLMIDEVCGVSYPLSILLEEDPFLCGEDSILLRGNFPTGEFSNYVWNDGSNGRDYVVTEKGIYHYRFEIPTGSGCFMHSYSVFVSDTTPPKPEIAYLSSDRSCFGDTLGLISDEQVNYAWNNGDTTREIRVTESGEYFMFTETVCGTTRSDTLSVLLLDASDIPVTSDTIEGPGVAIIAAEGDDVSWYADPDLIDFLASGNLYTTPEIDETTSYFAVNTTTVEGSIFNGGELTHRGSTFYNADQLRGAMLFDCVKPCTMTGFTVYTDFPGPRALTVLDPDGEVIWIDTVQCEEGATRIEMELSLTPGDGYTMINDSAYHVQNWGFLSPRLRRNENATAYPYDIGGSIILQNSNYGAEYYYYFYDITVQEEDLICTGEPIEVKVVVEEPNASINPELEGKVSVFPNPTADSWIVQWSDLEVERIILTDISGRDVFNLKNAGKMQNISIDADRLVPGAYVLKLISLEGEVVRRLIKQ